MITMFGKLIVTIVQFATTIVLAYLLDPTDFGIVAMCTIFINFFENKKPASTEADFLFLTTLETRRNLLHFRR